MTDTDVHVEDSDLDADLGDLSYLGDNEDEGIEPDADGVSADEGGSREGAVNRGVDRAKIRRVASKAVELSAAPERQRAVLATLFNCPDDAVSLTTAVFTGDRSALSLLTALEEAMTADPFSLGAMVMDMANNDRAKLRALFQLAGTFGADVPERVPAGAMNAAKAFAGGVSSMPKDAPTNIEQLRNLAKRA